MIYTVKRIDEDLDFGCEERTEDAPVMAVVTLISPAGEETRVKEEDALLYAHKIREGDHVYFDASDHLAKALGSDWTSRCSTKPVNTTAFVDMIMAAQAGKPVNWKCPFCGGDVTLMETDGEHAEIGCTECDMRITLDSYLE